MKSCFFIGHREASSENLPALRTTIEQHIVEYGVTEFFVGRYGFDFEYSTTDLDDALALRDTKNIKDY